jgi:hypothetical protein
MNANIEISKQKKEDAVVIEQDYIIDYGDEKFVFVLEGDIAKKKVLELDGRDGNRVLIVDGLNLGDRLVVEGFQALADGDKVQVVQ